MKWIGAAFDRILTRWRAMLASHSLLTVGVCLAIVVMVAAAFLAHEKGGSPDVPTTDVVTALGPQVMRQPATTAGGSDVLTPPDVATTIGMRWIRQPGTEAAYVGSETCRPCHASEFAAYAASPHSHTLHRIADGQERPEFAKSQMVADKYYGILYSVRHDGGRNLLVATSTAKSREAVAAAARWVFGSGTHASTYLAQKGDRFLQLRVTYYPPVRKWNFTPGSGPDSPLHEALGDPFTSAQAAACFGCHSTVLTGNENQLDLTHSILNVGCESCHGPGRSHVESVSSGSAAIVMPPPHTGPQIMQLCGSCHRTPVPVADQSIAAQAELARITGVSLPRSRCFIESAGKLSCVTCHNPHQSTAQQTEADFDRKCMTCHSQPHGTLCSHGETSRCVSCHMPMQRIARDLPLSFHNHWIRKYRPPAASGLPQANQPGLRGLTLGEQ